MWKWDDLPNNALQRTRYRAPLSLVVQPGAGARLNGAASERAACTAACAGRTRGENRRAFGPQLSRGPVRRQQSQSRPLALRQ